MSHGSEYKGICTIPNDTPFYFSDKAVPPPGAVVAARRLAYDPRAEPQYAERVPYVITRGEPKSRLVERAFAPEELLRDRLANRIASRQALLRPNYFLREQTPIST